MKKFVIVMFGILLVLVIVIISMGIFTVSTFLGILFYALLYGGGYYYVAVGMRERDKEVHIMQGRKQKFEWCWERVNKILKGMPGGQGLQWAQGVGRRSQYQTFYDGVQNKPFRSILAYLENTQQIALVIYDIDGDDIAQFITNPGPEYYDDPFYRFKPFSGRGAGMMGRDGIHDPYSDPYDYRRSSRGRNKGVSIHVGNDDYNDFDSMRERMSTPSPDVVDKAVEKMSEKKNGR